MLPLQTLPFPFDGDLLLYLPIPIYQISSLFFPLSFFPPYEYKRAGEMHAWFFGAISKEKEEKKDSFAYK